MYSSVEVGSTKPSVDEGPVVFPNPSVVKALDIWVMFSVRQSSTSPSSSPSYCLSTSCTVISSGLLCSTHLIIYSLQMISFLLCNFDFLFYFRSSECDSACRLEQVCAELEPPAQELDTHGKKPENQPHHFVFSSEPTTPLFFFKRTNRTTEKS